MGTVDTPQTMKAKSDFKVVIGGGGITGLALANMLQLYHIDYIMLEAYPHIAPQVGASIGILPHGSRILDQLGLNQRILDLAPPADSFHFRDETGNIICEFRGMKHSFNQRHGYPITFLDRQTVLQVLYDNIREKERIHTSKRLKKVDMTDDGVIIETSDGSFYRGDILVGADGIHSSVRAEMWRIANEMAPGWIPKDEHASVPCDYGCVFGISKPCEGINPGELNSVFKEHASYLVNGGPGELVYWFYFFKLAQRAYGKDIPSYTKEDERILLEQREDDNITPTLKFKTILDRRITSALVPLEEYVFEKWHFKRIMTIGDAAHKFHPIAGHGGNASIESAATLVNAIRQSLAKSENAKPTLEQIEAAFTTTQEIRQPRVTALKEHSHEQGRTESLDTMFHKITAFHVLPRVDAEDVTFNFSRHMPLSEKLDSPEMKPVPRLVPYKDELLSTPVSRGRKKWYLIGFYLLMSGLAYLGMWVRSDFESCLEAVLETGNLLHDKTFPHKRKYLGIRFIDNYLSSTIEVYSPGLNNWDPSLRLFELYFLGMFVQPIAVWSVEAFRKRNMLTPISFITVWLFLLQWAGTGVIIPIYYAMHTYISEPETYWWPLNRVVPTQYARALMWAMVIYILPTFLLFLPWKAPQTTQSIGALWVVSFTLVPLTCGILGYLYARAVPLKEGPPTAKETFPDVPYLKRLYLLTGILGLTLHVYCIAQLLLSPVMSFGSVFWPDFRSEPKALEEHSSFLLTDFWSFQVSTYAWLCMAVWDLKRMGRTTVAVGKASALIALGSVAFGPGATMSAVWYWRETALAETMFTRTHA